jgi:hypothetical protein
MTIDFDIFNNHKPIINPVYQIFIIYLYPILIKILNQKLKKIKLFDQLSTF